MWQSIKFSKSTEMFSKNRLQTSIQAFFKLLSYLMSANQCSNFSCFFCLFVLFAWCHHWMASPIYRDKVSQLGKIWTIQLSKYRKLFPRPSNELKKKKKRATNQVSYLRLDTPLHILPTISHEQKITHYPLAILYSWSRNWRLGWSENTAT